MIHMTTDLERVIREKLEYHRDNLELWQHSVLDPTEPDDVERIKIKAELAAAITELEWVLSTAGLELI